MQLLLVGLVLGAGLAAAAIEMEFTPAARATIALLALLTGAVGSFCFKWWREQRVLIEATEIAARFARGERGLRISARGASAAFGRFLSILNRAADNIATREAQFALLVSATGDAVRDWDLGTDIVACTQGGLAVGGETETFVEPLAWWQDRVHPDDRMGVEAAVAAIRANESDVWSVEYRFLHSNGTYRCVWDRGVVLRNVAGTAVRIIGCMTDISARKEAEEMLQHVERRQRALITAISSMVWREDFYAPLQPHNHGWQDFTGQTWEEECRGGWLNAVHPDDRDHVAQAWMDAKKDGSIYRAELRVRNREGNYRWMSARGAPVHDQSGKIVEWIGLYEDVHEQYAAKEALSAKSAELGARVKELRCLHAITVGCNRDEADLADILAGVALVLPTALTRPASGVCRITCNEIVTLSPRYVEPVMTISAPIGVDDVSLGEITLGYKSLIEAGFMAEELQLLKTAANLVSQMLARRSVRERLQQQSQELWRRQAMFEQTERLAKVGGWEYDVATHAVTWSEELRRIAACYTQGDAVDPAEGGALSSAFLQDTLDEALRTRLPFDRELAWTLPNGVRKWLHTVGQVQIVDNLPVRVFGIVKDITEEKEARSRIWHLANHDALTGLPNRRHFQAKLDEALAAGDRAHSLLLIDLDRFKEVNDTLGHDVGDALLRVVAERLGAAAEQGATVARLGGDEFAVLAPAAGAGSAHANADGLLAELRQPLLLAGKMTSIGFSAGLAVSPGHGSSAAELLKNADIALYFGKTRGRSALVSYEPTMREAMERRIAVCSEVREGLASDQFVPFYQPKVCLKSGTITGFEALLRWNHPSGLRSPAAVLPAFDDHELAIALFRRMFARTVADMVNWRESGLAFGNVALNTAAAEYSGFDLSGHVLNGLQEASLPASALGIEVTETVLLGRDGEAVSPTLRRLYDAGVNIALDDFGTGYASLTHLQQYPVDIIKIDQSFVRSLASNVGSQAIVAAVLGLGRNLGMTVIAEGVETAEQAELLRAAGCDQAQGYYFAKPMPGENVPGFLRNWEDARSTLRIQAA